MCFILSMSCCDITKLASHANHFALSSPRIDSQFSHNGFWHLSFQKSRFLKFGRAIDAYGQFAGESPVKSMIFCQLKGHDLKHVSSHQMGHDIPTKSRQWIRKRSRAARKKLKYKRNTRQQSIKRTRTRTDRKKKLLDRPVLKILTINCPTASCSERTELRRDVYELLKRQIFRKTELKMMNIEVNTRCIRFKYPKSMKHIRKCVFDVNYRPVRLDGIRYFQCQNE